MFRSVIILFVVLILGQTLPALEVPPITPQDFGATPVEAAWYWQLLANTTTMGVILWIIRKVADTIIGWQQWKNDDLRVKAIRTLESGVDTTYREFVRTAKTDNKGKLTEAQKNEALNRAVRIATDFARNQGFDLAKTLGKEMIPVVIERIIRTRKGGSIVPPPLPDLEPSRLSVM